MNKPTVARSIGVALVLAILLALGIYGFMESKKARKQLQITQTQNEQLNQQLSAYQAIDEIDGFLLDQDYEKALAAYRSLNIESLGGREQIAARLESRIKLTNQLINLSAASRSASDSLSIKSPGDRIEFLPTSPLDLNLVGEGRNQELADSLLFVLEKSRMEVKRLTNQLARNTSGNYLTFQSTKGNTVHYVGEVMNGKANGTGVGILATGSRYEGSWKDNRKHGSGHFYWLDGASYNGGYENDLRQGQGTYLWPNGEKFIGQWKNDVRNGEGTFYGEDGKIVAKGQWSNDELIEEK